jgi:pyocin large subunit-like protein
MSHRNIFTAAAAFIFVFLFLISPVQAQDHDESNAVSDGGIQIDGWHGQIDPQEVSRGSELGNAKLTMEDGALSVTTGPAVVYWKENSVSKGNYTVMATFTEAEFMTLSGHPHPYGLFIGGHDMGTENQSLMYCSAYGNGSFIARGFGPDPFRINAERPEANDAVNKADGTGSSVEQAIAITVSDDKVECSVNGTVVGSYPKSDIVGDGKLKSTDGVYGIRFGHNTAGTVKGLHSM